MMQIRFWGTRGSCAAPFEDRMEYGGNTSCVSVELEDCLVVFDGGTGIAALGHFLEQEGKCRQKPVHLFLSHLHLDHICGLPVFQPLFWENAEIHLYGEPRDGKPFLQALGEVLGPPFWPVTLEEMKAPIRWHDIRPGEVWRLGAEGGKKEDGGPGECRGTGEKGRSGECRGPGEDRGTGECRGPGEGAYLTVMRACHPDQCVIFRLESRGRSVVYGLDCEVTEEFYDSYREFAMNCGLLIFDAPYSQEEYPMYQGFGHSTWEMGVRLAEDCHAGRLCISHHQWDRTDRELRELERRAVDLSQSAVRGPEVVFAREGQVICLA